MGRREQGGVNTLVLLVIAASTIVVFTLIACGVLPP